MPIPNSAQTADNKLFLGVRADLECHRTAQHEACAQMWARS